MSNNIWKAKDGTLYGRDKDGRWIELGMQRGMSDAHIQEWAAERALASIKSASTAESVSVS